ncbi:MAG: RdgB/HAM1 family non-canonical purine NTP pyrophosphatase [Chitinophagaceae bacterium]|jgi:XTP/dITP diphosphohydrolase|nr:RdgB/HAM1 family non-canonical purine NTP pyrophosphatase [Chitinophagaceae bacterium]MCE2971914.1 RdgB/HAM1 family non-canonical purine NTP pyrophosphatase [Sediminibacterium sp.]MCA6467150.1 RdgB/HAM1 family non-canonical purine NTP pyrophosphatase [Chitinophagaceae bacterium]MCA6485649.1 RdgB/HAM1 family non-canonical purine NTP pyrophosphatase [Chitinophagaceae bacterium]MCA6494171.1 RdgB/HAM1 family non-canonical purine NTP pyrophosphatase [Chitinophagaceae bacterium]
MTSPFTLLFASNNRHKAEEINSILGEQFQIITLAEAGIVIDIPEPHDTIAANAAEKSSVIFQLTGKNCFGEDTGLEVEALGGAPGVKSARFAGEKATALDNMTKLQELMKGQKNRKARFVTVISLRLNGEHHLFSGMCSGTLAEVPAGKDGFGYDPLFIPDGSKQSFAEMSMDEKNKFSHRKKAVQAMITFLQQVEKK